METFPSKGKRIQCLRFKSYYVVWKHKTAKQRNEEIEQV